MRFERHVGVAYDTVTLYRSQAEFEAKIEVLLRDPRPLKRFNDRLTWRRIPSQTSIDRPFLIELPAISEDGLPNALRDIPAFRPIKRRNLPGLHATVADGAALLVKKNRHLLPDYRSTKLVSGELRNIGITWPHVLWR